MRVEGLPLKRQKFGSFKILIENEIFKMAITHCIAIEPKESKSRGSLRIHVYEHGMTSIEISRLKIHFDLYFLF